MWTWHFWYLCCSASPLYYVSERNKSCPTVEKKGCWIMQFVFLPRIMFVGKDGTNSAIWYWDNILPPHIKVPYRLYKSNCNSSMLEAEYPCRLVYSAGNRKENITRCWKRGRETRMMEGGSEGEKSWNRIFNEEPPLRCPLECLPRRPFQLAYKSTSFTLLQQ